VCRGDPASAIHLNRPQRVAAEVEPKQPVPERDLVLELGLLNGPTARVARIALAATAPRPNRFVPWQVVRDELAQNEIGKTGTAVHCGGPVTGSKGVSHITGVLTPDAPTRGAKVQVHGV
jgi:hypothetical protein